MRKLLTLSILVSFFMGLGALLHANPRDKFNLHIGHNIPVYVKNNAGPEFAKVKTSNFVKAKGSLRARNNLKKQGGGYTYLGTIPTNKFLTISIRYKVATNTNRDERSGGIAGAVDGTFDGVFGLEDQGSTKSGGQTQLLYVRNLLNTSFRKTCCNDKDATVDMKIGYKRINIRAEKKGLTGIRYTPAKAIFIEFNRKVINLR